MPELSRFYGLEVKFRFNDHLPPHIHVTHDGKTSLVSIETGEVIKGDLIGQGRRMIKEWIQLHKEELKQIWETQEVNKIPPLE